MHEEPSFPRDPFSRRLAQLIDAVCQSRGWSVGEFCRRVPCGRTPSTLRRSLRGEAAYTLDDAMRIIVTTAELLACSPTQLLQEILQPSSRADDPLVQLRCASFWHPSRRRVRAPLSLLERNLRTAQKVRCLETGFPPYLLPPHLSGRFAHTRAAGAGSAASDAAVARQMHGILWKRLAEENAALRAAVFAPLEAFLALASLSGPFHGWSVGDRAEVAQHVVFDWMGDRGLSIGLIDPRRGNFPREASELTGSSAAVLAVEDRLVFEHPTGFGGRRYFERSSDATRNRYVDYQVARLDVLEEWVARTSPPGEVIDLLFPFLPRPWAW